MYKNYLIATFLLMCSGYFIPVTGNAQEKAKFNLMTDDITQILPPMSALLDSAFAHDPGLKYTQLQSIIDNGNLRTTQTLWTQNLGFQANAGYGTFDYLYNNNIGGSTQQTTTLTQNETQYGLGAFFRLPLSDLVNRRNQVKIARAVLLQSETLSETRRNEIRELVIKQYNDMVVKQRVMKIKSRYLETSRINLQTAEKGFLNGVISVDNYSRVSEVGSQTETDFEIAKMDFINSYMIMEVITGTKFNIINEIPPNNEAH